MATKIVKVMTEIMFVLFCLVVYFIQVKNYEAIMFYFRLMLAVFVGFSFVFLLLHVAEKSGRSWMLNQMLYNTKAHYLVIIMALVYPAYRFGRYLVDYSTRMEQRALAEAAGASFWEGTVIAIGFAFGLAALLCELAKTKEGRR